MTSSPFDPAEPAAPATPSAPPPLPPGQANAPLRAAAEEPVGSPLCLSLFPGLGQVYNGRVAQGFVFFFAVASAPSTSRRPDHAFPFAFLIPFVYLFNLVDAWKSANAINARFLGGRSEAEDSRRRVAGLGRLAGRCSALRPAPDNLGWLDLARLRATGRCC